MIMIDLPDETAEFMMRTAERSHCNHELISKCYCDLYQKFQSKVFPTAYGKYLYDVCMKITVRDSRARIKRPLTIRSKLESNRPLSLI